MPNDILLRDVPDDVLKIILKRQWDEKDKKLRKQYSLASAVFSIIKEAEKSKNKEDSPT